MRMQVPLYPPEGARRGWHLLVVYVCVCGFFFFFFFFFLGGGGAYGKKCYSMYKIITTQCLECKNCQLYNHAIIPSVPTGKSMCRGKAFRTDNGVDAFIFTRIARPAYTHRSYRLRSRLDTSNTSSDAKPMVQQSIQSPVTCPGVTCFRNLHSAGKLYPGITCFRNLHSAGKIYPGVTCFRNLHSAGKLYPGITCFRNLHSAGKLYPGVSCFMNLHSAGKLYPGVSCFRNVHSAGKLYPGASCFRDVYSKIFQSFPCSPLGTRESFLWAFMAGWVGPWYVCLFGWLVS